MSDLDELRDLLTRTGVVFTEGPHHDDPASHAITIEAEAGPKNVGYHGFVTEIKFDGDGGLISWGCWE